MSNTSFNERITVALRIIKEKDEDFLQEPTHQKPSGWRAWFGEYTILGIMAAAAITTGLSIYNNVTTTAGLLELGGVSLGGGWLSALASVIPVGIGALAGGYANKRMREYEADHGVVIKKPSFFNMGILSQGLLKGALHGFTLIGGLGLLGLGTALPNLIGLENWAMLGSSGWMSPMIALGIAGAGAAVGAVTGSIAREKQMEDAYQQAGLVYSMQTGDLSHIRDRSRGYTLGPGIAAGAGITSVTAGTAGISPEQFLNVAANAPVFSREQIEQAKNAHDFSYLGEGHPAQHSTKEFAKAELARRLQEAAARENGESPPPRTLQ